jgi:hypothetical protein
MLLHRIIVERDTHGTWRAWFSDAPDTAFVSRNLFSAIDFLATLFPGKRVDSGALFLDEGRSRENHCEFLAFTPRET